MSDYHPVPRPGWYRRADGYETWWTGRGWSTYRRPVPRVRRAPRRGRAVLVPLEIYGSFILGCVTLGWFSPRRYWASRVRYRR